MLSGVRNLDTRMVGWYGLYRIRIMKYKLKDKRELYWRFGMAREGYPTPDPEPSIQLFFSFRLRYGQT